MNNFTTDNFKVASALMALGHVPKFLKQGKTLVMEFEYKQEINDQVNKFWSGELRLDPLQCFNNQEIIGANRFNYNR